MNNNKTILIPNVSERYIRAIRNNQTQKRITSERYFKAILTNTGSKVNLATKLGVSERTLTYFEKDTQIKKQTAEYLKIKGMGLHAIAEKMGTNINTLKAMGIDKISDIFTIKEQIETITRIFENVAEWNAEATTLFYQWKKILNQLN